MIYFVQCERSTDRVFAGWIKIGTTVRLSARLKQIAADLGHSPTLLGILDGGSVEERALHRRFRRHRETGEWFAPHGDLLDLIRAEAREWDGADECKELCVVKIRHETFASARIVAALRNQPMSDIISDILDPILSDMANVEIAKRADQLAKDRS